MNLTVAINLAVCICALTGFFMGVQTYFRKGRPLYSQMVTIALGCAALGRLSNAIVILCTEELPRTFNAGLLAAVGCFIFIFDANYGQMDSLCDMSEKKNKTIRKTAVIAPLLLLAAAVFVLLNRTETVVFRVCCAAVIVSAALASYFNCKHLMIKDVKGGILDSIRGYNLTALILELLYTLEILFDVYGWNTLKSVIYVLMCATFLAVIPVLKKGDKKWKV